MLELQKPWLTMSAEDGLGISIGEGNFIENANPESTCFGEVHILLRKGHYVIVYKKILPSSTSRVIQASCYSGAVVVGAQLEIDDQESHKGTTTFEQSISLNNRTLRSSGKKRVQYENENVDEDDDSEYDKDGDESDHESKKIRKNPTPKIPKKSYFKQADLFLDLFCSV